MSRPPAAALASAAAPRAASAAARISAVALALSLSACAGPESSPGTTQETGGAGGGGGADAAADSPLDAPPEAGADADAASCHREPDLPERSVLPCQFPAGPARCEDDLCSIFLGCMVLGAGWCEPGRAATGEDPVQVTMGLAPQMGAHEVTRAEWLAVGFALPEVAGGAPDGGRDAWGPFCQGMDCPITGVSWVEAVVYANARSDAESLPRCYQVTGCSGAPGVDLECQFVSPLSPGSTQQCPGYHLPTAAEWEYAARAGTRTAYWSGPATEAAAATGCWEEPALAGHAWYCASSGGGLHPVGQLPANGLGLFDMLGNAAEWVEDELAFDPGLGPLQNPGGNVTVDVGAGAPRQIRGGSFSDRAGALRAAARRSAPPSARLEDVGFRVVRWVPWVGP